MIEQAIRSAGVSTVGPAGYLVGYGLAEANLGPGRVVVADSTNPLHITRQAWRDAAARAGARHLDVEVTCSDAPEHRRRVETRVADIPGHILPDWADVQAHQYEAWHTPHLIVDTASASIAASIIAIKAALPAEMADKR